MRNAKTLLFGRSIGLAVLLFVVFALAYLAFSGSLSVSEIIVAVAAGTISAVSTLAIMRLADMQQVVAPSLLLALTRPTLDMGLEIFPMTRALVLAVARRQFLVSQCEVRRFDPGRDDDPRDRGRRALVTIAISLAPARLVSDRDVDTSELRIRRLGVAAKPDAAVDSRWPL